MSPLTWRWILAAYISLFVFAFVDNLRGPIYPLFLSSYQVTTDLGSYFFFCSSLGSLLSQWSTRYWLPIFQTALSSVIWATIGLVLAILGIGLSGHFGASIIWVFLCCTFFGFFMEMTAVCQNIFVSMGSSPERRNRYFAGLHAMYGVGAFTAPIVTSHFLQMVTWPVYYLWVSVLGVIALAYYFSMPRLELKEPIHSFGREDRYRYRDQLVLGFALGFAVIGELLISSRMVLVLTRGFDFDSIRAAHHLSLFFLCLTAGRLSFAVLPIPIAPIHTLMLSSMVSAFYTYWALLNAPAWLFVVGFFVGPFFPAMMTVVSLDFSGHFAAVSARVFVVMGLLIVIMHKLTGFLMEYVGAVLATKSTVIYFLLSAVLVFVYRRRSQKLH